MYQMPRPARIVECAQISTYGEGPWMADIAEVRRSGPDALPSALIDLFGGENAGNMIAEIPKS
jgi:hypothetical protein